MSNTPCTSTVEHGLPPANHPTAVLVDVRTGGHPDEGFDRVVFDFRDNTSTPGFSVGYVPEVIEDPKGTPLPMLPGAKLLVTMRWAAAHENGAPTIPVGDRDLRPGLPQIRQVKLAGDFEGHLSFGIAVGGEEPVSFRAYSLSGARIVVDIAHAGHSPWYCGEVFFCDNHKVDANIDPPVTAVERRLDKPAVAGAALRALFEGPTESERGRGLRFVDSHATGFTDLRVDADRVAHVLLLGPINSDGSAVITIAGEIMPTLKQFPTVDWVKIYDEHGVTQHPTGQRDSIPVQLEP
ncbi:GerMN domain-containing protein [Actinokineospora enzanensis]|uniref:GerMN domain-containing protein n=1 Tax=Actinokineospora enzanensis TaxID=155975 RepID=UPI0003A9B939|nr:GerMN domain-containing protein [Actinokineospora enzanensis]